MRAEIRRRLENKVPRLVKRKAKKIEPPKLPKSIYSEVIAELICTRLSNGETLKSICRDEDFPEASTVMSWVNTPDEDRRPGFVQNYLQAKELGYQLMADEVIDIADDSYTDTKIRTMPNGVEVEYVDHEHINRAKLRVDSRKWMLSKVLPKIYGDKLEVKGNITLDLVGRLAQARQRLSLENETTYIGEAEEIKDEV